jgi:hypothetical protein
MKGAIRPRKKRPEEAATLNKNNQGKKTPILPCDAG